MLRYFRQLRQRLLTDSKFSKYLLYAVGEILLVVIGILIALQIDNWNEGRKSDISAGAYRDRLISDIVQDTTNIKIAMELRRKTIANIQSYYRFFDSNRVSIEENLDISSKVDIELNRYFPVNYTFEDMKSSGNMNLLNEEQQHIMSELSQAQERAQLVAEKLMTVFFHEANEEQKYLGNWRPNKKDFYEAIGMKKDPEAMAQGLLHRQNKFNSLASYHVVMIETHNQIIEKSKDAIRILQGED
ncbi:DUF6090 family protein [Robiginitalea sp. SC105]|uniref:DUF6090 family protein n=1 Tax=Robiginitalea sp. SC105 TaxID=2762332 RepID=UPI0016398FD2|nr:DUF6090 family protein [Robiginitalea sp. SC105]MBC2840082.1 hypothetical protein [Robiginitalea sp. SC105]